jgi:hypothetical protein
VVPLNWVLAVMGDFDGNGSTNLLWRDNNTGTVAIWLFDGLQVLQTGSFGAVRSNWLIATTGDYLLCHGVEAMANADQHPQAPPLGAPHINPVHQSPHLSFWIRELPFSLVLILTIGGVAYTSFSKHPILVYWEILAPIFGLVCVWYGWPSVDNSSRLRLIATQLLHWIAFLLVMNMVFLASVQRVLNATSTGLAVFTLLALGTFTAGVHILSWQICLLGLIMAFGIPAIAWIENSALLLVLVLAAIVGIGVVIWWHWHERRGRTV